MVLCLMPRGFYAYWAENLVGVIDVGEGGMLLLFLLGELLLTRV